MYNNNNQSQDLESYNNSGQYGSYYYNYYPYCNVQTSSPIVETQYYDMNHQLQNNSSYSNNQYYNNGNSTTSGYDSSYQSSPIQSSSSSSASPLVNNKSPQSVVPATKTSTAKRATAHNQLPDDAVDFLNSWFDSHINHPYPTTEEKHRISTQCCITVKQVNSWFCNRRNRSQNTKPKRIKRQLEQEIAKVYNELVLNPNKTEVIEKFRSTLIMHEIGVNK